MPRLIFGLSLPLFGLYSALSQEDARPVVFSEEERARIFQHAARPAPPDLTNRFSNHPGAAHLGRFLFFDTRFSANGKVSCATCHDPALGFADGRSLAVGLEPLERHTPSLWNTAYQRWFFWDGRRDSLWAQSLDPIEDRREMALPRQQLVQHLRCCQATRSNLRAKKWDYLS